MRLFDAHAHYCDEKYKDGLEAALCRAFDAGVTGILTCPSTLADTEFSAKLAQKYPQVYFAAGIHPEVCGDFEIDRTIDEIKGYLAEEKCVAVGECGLDYYHPENPPREVQKQWFEAQCLLAKAADMPVAVHDREAHGDTFEILSKIRPKGMLHCFSGSAESARQYVKMGFYISFGGVLTFQKSEKTRAAMCAVPEERLLFETDCPYLAPVPVRGRVNESAYMAHTVACAAGLRGVDANALASACTDNAIRLFGIKEDI